MGCSAIFISYTLILNFFIYIFKMKQRSIFLMIKCTIHKKDKCYKLLDTLTTKKQRYTKQKSEKYKGKEKQYNQSKIY